MELRDLQYFAAVAAEGHLGRAADRLGLSAPALSKSLRRLERAVQARVVRRTPRGLVVTPEGAALLGHVERLRLSIDDVVREVADLSQGRAGHLRLCTHPALVEDLLAPACEILLREAPKVTLSVSVETTDIAIPGVRRGDFDLALATLPANRAHDLQQTLLFTDRVVVFAAAAHRLAGRKDVRLQDLAGERWVVTSLNTSPGWEWLHRAFEESGLPLSDVAVRTSSLALRDHLVTTAGFLGFMSRRMLKRCGTRLGVVEIPVQALGWSRELGVTFRQDAYLSPVTRRMIAILEARAREIPGD